MNPTGFSARHRPDHSPTLSILIVNWNGSALTETCMKAIDNHTKSVDFRMVVVDNGSRPDELERLRRSCALHDAHLIELNENLFFGRANNIGAEAATGEYLLLLNNDVTVTPGYIEPLMAALRAGFQAGAVGPRFVYPDGRLQEAGAYIRPDGWSIRHGRDESPNPLIAGPGLHIVDYCSAACLLLRRDVFMQFGGFDALFDPAYFEDVDLSFRLRSKGLFTYYCGDVTVVHAENETSSLVWTDRQMNGVILESHRKFMLRWGAYVTSRMEADLELARQLPIEHLEPDA